MPRTLIPDVPAASPMPLRIAGAFLTERARVSAAADGLTEEILAINEVRRNRPEDTEGAAVELRRHFQAVADLAAAGLRALDNRLKGQTDA